MTVMHAVETGHATLSSVVNTFGQAMLRRYVERVHKIAIDAGFTCPNRDGNKGRGGCTFCNNVSFSPNGRHPAGIVEQLATAWCSKKWLVLNRITGALQPHSRSQSCSVQHLTGCRRALS